MVTPLAKGSFAQTFRLVFVYSIQNSKIFKIFLRNYPSILRIFLGKKTNFRLNFRIINSICTFYPFFRKEQMLEELQKKKKLELSLMLML
jgi:hypothetical protein